jgi:hypothetical protein
MAVFFIVYSFADTIGFSLLPHSIVGFISIITQATINLIVHNKQKAA